MTLTERQQRIVEANMGLVGRVIKDKVHGLGQEGAFTYDDLFPHYGGEFRKDVRERMINTLTDVMNKDDHKIVLAVSHAGACFSFFEVWENPDVISYGGGFTNCCILHFEFENNQFKFIEIIRPDVDC